MPVEIEMRARFSPHAHDRLVGRLRRDGEDLGPDDKRIHFYVLPDRLLKVTENVSTRTAKVSLKDSRIGRGPAFAETEFAIAPADVDTAVRLLDGLGFAAARHEAFTRRHNFRYDGVEIAVKWSEAWGHHAEFEVLLEDDAPEAARTAAVERITGVAAGLGVELMTEAELAEFTAAFEAREQERKESERWPAGT
ncbi:MULTISPECIES: CYTH domain-containing protein [Streptomyces]|uniref:CYTH domain-containing protein n=1 Tax=Streptomyces tsukubensis (strain DSM 42081 / NBRC 108919 / NRRL 18488 / 9993) TaxID=1114943 RepID=A0A7G3UDH0_STRT9|nr:hypothetical protein [Streptomyces tsukubensis]AZK95499.1 hypothetical protein B7R87_17740 [Streptomyces tsukubensis]MYS62574.1 hypothetical protein [Streptomyces sp. SID5473]QKM68457.1 hypothetical protein STSU_016060 [Streptomyces tsukubensis NRRL18488]TAI43270.1 hypothetical protein EWI31_15825 [Streptomyces tsukubensis]